MSTRQVTVVECDMCRKARNTFKAVIQLEGVRRQLDLCSECAAPLKRILAAVENGYNLFQPVDPASIAAARRSG